MSRGWMGLLGCLALALVLGAAPARAVTVTIPADYSAQFSAATKVEGPVDVGVTAGGTAERDAFRFPTTSIPNGAAIFQLQFQVEVSATVGTVSVDSWSIAPYFPGGPNGAGDPQADNAATGFSRCAAGTSYEGSSIAFRTTGTKTFTWTLTFVPLALADLTARVAASGTYSVAIRVTDEVTSNHIASIFGYLDVGHEPKLIVSYIPKVANADPTRGPTDPTRGPTDPTVGPTDPTR